jgi:hypothetical protein
MKILNKFGSSAVVQDRAKGRAKRAKGGRAKRAKGAVTPHDKGEGVYTHTHVHASKSTCIGPSGVHSSIRAHTHTHTHTHTCMNTHIHTCIDTCTHIYLQTHTHPCIHTRVHACKHALHPFIRPYTRTHTQVCESTSTLTETGLEKGVLFTTKDLDHSVRIGNSQYLPGLHLHPNSLQKAQLFNLNEDTIPDDLALYLQDWGESMWTRGQKGVHMIHNTRTATESLI